ncbi:MAG TPA: UDP-2,3-diacylglucosamine diphosphatase [Candidatus Bathyarchaeia archaeon]|nr:UDP-2,3-diacylglucosamine diphosphatase [Candidatus Bathyarchaeia archaeon]
MNKNKNINRSHTLIISDLHLGSRVSRAKEAAEFLKGFDFKKLILLGDVFEDLNLNRLRSDDWKFLALLAHISKTRKVRWVVGNHDKDLAKVFAALTGAKAYNVYTWRVKNKKYLAIHGHQFDNFLTNNPFLSVIAQSIYNFIQLVDFPDKRMSRYVKRKSKLWMRNSEKVASRAILFASLRGADCIFCGHTHKALQKKRGKIRYFNSGCWTEIPATYIAADGEKIAICKYQ